MKAKKHKKASVAGATNKESAAVPIVGIGASAGGLEAFTRLLKHLPLDTGLGFVLVQHLDPQHDSALTQLLARATYASSRYTSSISTTRCWTKPATVYTSRVSRKISEFQTLFNLAEEVGRVVNGLRVSVQKRKTSAKPQRVCFST